ncbi:hypothetical protein LINPERHAP1_LOCUS40494 [Linum perenne]
MYQEEGILGFRNFQAFNQALLTKKKLAHSNSTRFDDL